MSPVNGNNRSQARSNLTMSEFATLLKAARRLDREALTTVFDLFSSPLYKFVSRFVHDPELVDPIVTDVFAGLVEEFAVGKGPRSNLRCYLYQATYRRMVDHFHETRPHASLQIAVPADQQEKAARTTPEAEGRDRLHTLLAAMNTDLNDDQRLVIILRFLEDFSVKETAEILGKEISNIKVIQSRGFARLRKAMGMEPDEDPGNLLRLNHSRPSKY